MRSLPLLALLSGAALAAPTPDNSNNSCTATLASQWIKPDGSGTDAAACSCLSSCTQQNNCCDGVDTFTASLRTYVAANKGVVRMPAASSDPLKKDDIQVTLYRPYSDGKSLVAYKGCSFTRATEQDPWTQTHCQGEFDVAGFDTASGQFQPFESVISVPDQLQIAAGFAKAQPDEHFFYASLEGQQAVNAAKSVLTGIRVCGFKAHLPEVPTGKADFDPTPGRTWAVIKPEFAIVRSMGVEISDVTAEQLDSDYQGYASNARYYALSWQDCNVRQVMVGGSWQSTLADDGQTFQAIQSL
ncbi:hypothetical protein RI367_003052 [Sorochytrium milnesiophthora]